MTIRQALLVLGMHRSGTSALTRVLNLLGASLPKTLMAAHEDNQRGYWESQEIARFNNRLLESAGSRWDCDAPIPAHWFADESARAPQRLQARALIRTEYGDAKLMVLKDPRLCRLFPFWEKVLGEEGIACKVLLCLRNPLEVAYSLAARFQDPRLHPAAIRSHSRTMLLWLRHVVDAERSTRHLDRIAVKYSALLSNWRSELLSLPTLCDGLVLPGPQDPLGQEIDVFLSPQLHRHRRDCDTKGGDAGLGFIADVLDALQGCALSETTRELLDALAQDLDRLISSYAPLRIEIGRLAREDMWSDRVLMELQELHQSPRAAVMPSNTKPAVLFVSRTSESRAHHYRVVHPWAQLIERGWNARWLTPSDPALFEHIEKSDVVVVSRGPWGGVFNAIRQRCIDRKVPIICDVDDLIFEPGVLKAGDVEHFNNLNESAQANFLNEALDLQSALLACDAVIATTEPLARAASKYAPLSFVLPNCFSREMIAGATACLALPKPSSLDGILRVGFASGTPTHTSDFGTIADVVADFLRATPHARLVVLGYLDLAQFPALLGLHQQIELRPAVPLHQLSAELTRFDINLAPLEIGNPFCEAKSEIRFTAASALGIPTIAATTAPLSKAVIDGVSGFLARNSLEWHTRLQQLANDPALRFRLGDAARIDTMARFGPEKTARLLEHHLAEILGKGSDIGTTPVTN